MGFSGLQITEIFHSIQGETSLSGLRFAFIRLTGCNLRCTYCDSVYAFKGGNPLSIDEILTTIRPFHVKHVLITGGEPLLQRNTPMLVQKLQDEGYVVSIETHGEVSIEPVKNARIVMDVKTPGSRMDRGNYKKNLRHLKAGDEIKFVLTSTEDYAWAKETLWEISKEIDLKDIECIFSPVVSVKNSPQPVKDFDLKWLAEKLIHDRLNVRLQTQLHKIIWGSEKTGV